jgi:hypothetical protein
MVIQASRQWPGRANIGENPLARKQFGIGSTSEPAGECHGKDLSIRPAESAKIEHPAAN